GLALVGASHTGQTSIIRITTCWGRKRFRVAVECARMRPVALTALVVLLGSGALPAGAGLQFRAGVDLVSFAVVVTDRSGPVQGLTPDDFEIFEDGQPQPIQYFAEGDVSERFPLRLGLLMDVSGSMGKDIHLSRTAAIRFMNAVEHARDITLVDFDTQVRLARYSQADFPR